MYLYNTAPTSPSPLRSSISSSNSPLSLCNETPQRLEHLSISSCETSLTGSESDGVPLEERTEEYLPRLDTQIVGDRPQTRKSARNVRFKDLAESML